MVKSLDQALIELESSEPRKRANALQYFRVPRGEKTWPLVVAAMDDPNIGVRASAALVMGQGAVRTGQQALIDHLLEDPSDDVRWMCAFSLHFFKSERTMPAFIQALADSNDRVVCSACDSLGDYNHPDAINALYGMLPNPSWNARLHTCASLLKLQQVNAEVIACLEQLEREPEAQEHNADARRTNALNREIEGPNAEIVMDVTNDLLESARALWKQRNSNDSSC